MEGLNLAHKEKTVEKKKFNKKKTKKKEHI